MNSLFRSWQDSGIAESDIVLVHSSIRRTAIRTGLDAAEILDSFREAVGPKGILLFPTFNYGFCHSQPFDTQTTKSEMGILTECARTIGLRTGHPVYSFAIISDLTIAAIDNYGAFSKESPFAWLHRNNGKIAVLDLSERDSMTFYHYVEEQCDVPYRYHKEFTGQYNGAPATYEIFSRKLEDGIVTRVNPMGELCWSRGLYSGNRPGHKNGLRVINAAAMYLATKEIIEDGRAEGMLYQVEKPKKFYAL